MCNGLTNRLLLGNIKSFWSFWRSQFGCSMSNSAVINDLHDTQPISNEFTKSFNGNFMDNNTNVFAKDIFVSLYHERKLAQDGKKLFLNFTIDEINGIII